MEKMTVLTHPQTEGIGARLGAWSFFKALLQACNRPKASQKKKGRRDDNDDTGETKWSPTVIIRLHSS